jgi:hypothetical protein
MSEISKMPKGTGTMQGVKEDAGDEAMANALATHYQGVADGYDPEDRGSQEHEEHEDIANAFKKGIQAGMDEINMSDFEFSGNDFDIEQDGRGVVYEPVAKLLKKYNVSAGLNKKGEAFLIKDGKAITDPSHWNTSESAVQEDAGTMDWSTDKVKEFGDALIQLAKGQVPSDDLQIDDLEDGWAGADQDSRDQMAETIGARLMNVLVGYLQFSAGQKPSTDDVKDAQGVVNDPEFKKAYHSNESAVQEDAGEGHMSKSQLYATAKMAIELIDMIKKGDDLEGWVQTKLNLAADYLQAVYHYEDYQKLNPYREDLDSELVQKHAGVIQKNLDEILARETKTADVDTKPGMMRILKKRVNEVEKEIAKENRKNTDEGGMPSSVIKSKQMYANMTDKELADRFKGADEKTLRQMAWRHGYGNMSSHYLDRVKNVMTGKKTATTEAELEEGLKDWAKKTAAAGIIVAGLAGFNSINNAIDNSVPAIQAMNSALEMAIDQNDDKLAQLIKKDLSDAKLRLSSGKDLGAVADMQEKYAKFMKTEGLAYESKLAVQLNQQLK